MVSVGQKSSIRFHQLPKWRIAACAIAMCGIQVCYAAQINLGTPTLLLLGISERGVALAWLAGPLSGLIVQPVIGLISDSCTSPFGRRRPFLVAGTIFTTLALLLFSNALWISQSLFGDMGTKLALYLAIFSFFLLDFSIQAIQAPLRALVTDVVPGNQRALANAYVGFFTGLGNLLGGVLTALDLKNTFTFFKNDVQALFSTSILILVVTVSISVLFTTEMPLSHHGNNWQVTQEIHEVGEKSESYADSSVPLLSGTGTFGAENQTYSERRSILKVLREVPKPFWQVFLIQLCTWSGFFTLFVYVNTWVGRNIYLGDAKAPHESRERNIFDEGVRLGGKGNAITAVVTLLYSLALPRLLRALGTTWVYAISQITEAGCLMAAPFIRGVPGQSHPSALLKNTTLLDIGLFGIVWATTMGVPWTLIGDALDSDPWYSQRIGLFTTLFNASQSFPQLLVAFASPSILEFAKNDPSYVMLVGGICALAGVLLVFLSGIGNFERRIRRVDSSRTIASLSNIYGSYSDLLTHSDFLGIFERNFESYSELSTHAENTAHWMGSSGNIKINNGFL